MLTTLEKYLDHPEKNLDTLNKKFEPIKNKTWSLQNFGPLKVEPKNFKKMQFLQYFHKSFTNKS